MLDLVKAKENKRNVVQLKCQLNKDCAICLSNMFQKPATHTYCGHSFHTHCLRKWKFKNNNCPLCREQFPELENDNQLMSSELINIIIDLLYVTEENNISLSELIDLVPTEIIMNSVQST